MRRRRIILVAVAAAIVCRTASAQTVSASRNPADGSTPVALAPGAPAGSYVLSGFEQINVYNGHLNIALPLLAVGGRGDANFTLTALVSHPKWSVDTHTQVYPRNGTGSYDYQHTFGAVEQWSPYEAGYGPGMLLVKRTGDNLLHCDNGNPAMFASTFTYLVFVGPDGTEHSLYAGGPKPWDCSFSTGSDSNRGSTFTSRDGSGITFVGASTYADVFDPAQYPAMGEQVAGNGDLMFRDGTRYEISNGQVMSIRDRNGNKITFTYYAGTSKVNTIVDSIGRDIDVKYDFSDAVCTSCDRIRYKGENGEDRFIHISKALPGARLRSDYSPSAPLFPEMTNSVTGSPGIRIAWIRLPNGRTNEFFYTPHGEVARLVLPTGGAIEYDHGQGIDGSGVQGIYASGQVRVDPAPTLQVANSLSVPPPTAPPYIYRRLLARREHPDGGTGVGGGATAAAGTTTYVRFETAAATGAYAEVTKTGSGVTTPMVERHYFHSVVIGQPVVGPTASGPASSLGAPSGAGLPDPFEGKEYRTEVPGLRRAETVWGVEADGGSRECQENTTLLDVNKTSGRVLRYDRLLDGTPVASTSRFGNLTDVYELDFGTAPAIQTAIFGPYTHNVCPNPPTNYARRRHTDFVLDAAYTAPTVHLRGLPSLEQVFGASGPAAAQTKFVYDAQSDASCPASALEPRSGIIQHDAVFGTSYSTRGNARCVGRWLNATSQFLMSRRQFDIAGNAIQQIDPKSNITNIDFTDAYDGPPPPGPTFAFPWRVTNPLGHITRTRYRYWLGRPSSFEDANNRITTYSYTDVLDRLRFVTPPIGQTEFQYDDTGRVITTRVQQAATQWIVSDSRYDGMGRTIQQRQYTGSATILTDRDYDGLSRLLRVSNPYTSGSPVWTTHDYDGLGRAIRATHPDGSMIQTAYPGEKRLITDEAGNQRELTADGLGRLVGVVEGGFGYTTTYLYDTLDNLTQVNQATQTRTFTYDSLSRLTQSNNPESGVMSYIYDANGNLASRTDARGTTNYSPAGFEIDALNRVRKKTYPAGTPEVSYTYDSCANGIGRLCSVSNSVSATSYSYDVAGRVSASTQTTGSVAYNFSYGYSLAGALSSISYPSGRVVTTGYDIAGRPASLTSGATTYAETLTYAPHGGLSQWMRRDPANAATIITEAISHNSRLQPEQIRLDRAGVSQLTLDYRYCPGGAQSCTSNNGNVRRQAIGFAGFAETQDYTYDAVNRLASMGSALIGEGYGYDTFGNRWVSTHTGLWSLTSQTPQAQSWFNGSNRVGTWSYDAVGSLAAMGGNAMVYDAENRLTSVTGTTTASYEYDGDGRRARKTSGGVATVYVYDAFGQLAAEYGPITEAGTKYLTVDHLGSTRLVADAGGNPEARYDYLPFGEEIPAGYGGRTEGMKYRAAGSLGLADGKGSQKFTGKERDAETGLDYFLARYNSGPQGRFISPDPVWITPRRMLDPQELNLYAYVRNNPLRYVDPDGTILELAASSEEDAKRKFALIRRGLRQQDRGHAQLVVGDGKNGFGKGHFGITVDKDYKSNSGNFQTLQGVANSKDLAIAAIVSPRDKFASNLGVQKGDTVVIATFKSQFGQDNYVSSRDAVPGQTLFQLFGSPMKDHMYSPDQASRVYVANDQVDSEIVKTFFHELRHVFLGDFGRNIVNGSHPAADRDIQGIQRESDRNFSGTPVRKK